MFPCILLLITISLAHGQDPHLNSQSQPKPFAALKKLSEVVHGVPTGKSFWTSQDIVDLLTHIPMQTVGKLKNGQRDFWSSSELRKLMPKSIIESESRVTHTATTSGHQENIKDIPKKTFVKKLSTPTFPKGKAIEKLVGKPVTTRKRLEGRLSAIKELVGDKNHVEVLRTAEDLRHLMNMVLPLVDRRQPPRQSENTVLNADKRAKENLKKDKMKQRPSRQKPTLLSTNQKRQRDRKLQSTVKTVQNTIIGSGQTQRHSQQPKHSKYNLPFFRPLIHYRKQVYRKINSPKIQDSLKHTLFSRTKATNNYVRKMLEGETETQDLQKHTLFSRTKATNNYVRKMLEEETKKRSMGKRLRTPYILVTPQELHAYKQQQKQLPRKSATKAYSSKTSEQRVSKSLSDKRKNMNTHVKEVLRKYQTDSGSKVPKQVVYANVYHLRHPLQQQNAKPKQSSGMFLYGHRKDSNQGAFWKSEELQKLLKMALPEMKSKKEDHGISQVIIHRLDDETNALITETLKAKTSNKQPYPPKRSPEVNGRKLVRRRGKKRLMKIPKMTTTPRHNRSNTTMQTTQMMKYNNTVQKMTVTRKMPTTSLPHASTTTKKLMIQPKKRNSNKDINKSKLVNPIKPTPPQTKHTKVKQKATIKTTRKAYTITTTTPSTTTKQRSSTSPTKPTTKATKQVRPTGRGAKVAKVKDIKDPRTYSK